MTDPPLVSVDSQTICDAEGRYGVYSGPIDDQDLPHGQGWMLYHTPPPEAPPPPPMDDDTPAAAESPPQQKQHKLVKYEGLWEHGKWKDGTFHTIHGHVYTGTPAQGRWKYANQQFFEGMVDEKYRPVHGVYQWPNHTRYEGEFNLVRQRDGYGCYEDPHARIRYEGQWQKGVYQGKGTYSWMGPNDGLPHVYRGEFVQGQPHGSGVERVNDRIVHDGFWDQGQPLKCMVPEAVPASVVAERVAASSSHKAAIKRDIQVVHNRVWMNGSLRAIYRGLWDTAAKQPTGNGTAVFEHASSTEQGLYQLYEGCFENGQFHGQGRLVFTNDDMYEGVFVSGKRHGKGHYEWADGRHYTGDFCENDRHGSGTASYPDGSFYEGDFDHGKRSGKGRFLFGTGGSMYEGDWKDGTYHGQGSMVHSDGTIYEGEFVNGLSHGHGVETAASGETLYEGEFIEGLHAEEYHTKQRQKEEEELLQASMPPTPKRFETPQKPVKKASDKCEAVVDELIEDAQGNKGRFTGILMTESRKPHGTGRLVYLDGKRIHEGFWKDGKKEGHGRCLFFPQRDFHEGEYKNNLRHGPGRYEWKDGRSFKGAYENDLRHGLGVFSYPGGERYEGDFDRGRRSGSGVFVFDQGRGKYEGEWENGKYNGQGSLRWGAGFTYTGEFQDGVFHGTGCKRNPLGHVLQEGEFTAGKFQPSVPETPTTRDSVSDEPPNQEAFEQDADYVATSYAVATPESTYRKGAGEDETDQSLQQLEDLTISAVGPPTPLASDNISTDLMD